MKRCLTTMSVAFLAVSAALAQEKKAVPPPPKPADEGPSLEVTMQFIADKISQQGKVSYAAYGHDSSNNSDSVNEFAYETTNVKATPVQCRMDYQRNLTLNGMVEIIDRGFELVAVQDVLVMSLEQAFGESNAELGHPARSSKVNPPAWVMRVRRRVDAVGSQENVKRYRAHGNPLDVVHGHNFDVSITRKMVGEKYHYLLDFAAPPANRIAFSDSVTIYGFRYNVTGWDPAPPIPTATGRWLPGDPVHLEFDVPKQFTDSSQGWVLLFCIGTRSGCFPGPNLLEVGPPRAHEFLFHDEEMANRVAKAMLHAVELCGGGSKPEPF